MLREEKIRNRVEKLKPKVTSPSTSPPDLNFVNLTFPPFALQLERDLLDHLPIWEERYGRPFLVHGERIIDVIEDAILAKEAEKEQRKVCHPPTCRLSPSILPDASSLFPPSEPVKAEQPPPLSASDPTPLLAPLPPRVSPLEVVSVRTSSNRSRLHQQRRPNPTSSLVG